MAKSSRGRGAAGASRSRQSSRPLQRITTDELQAELRRRERRGGPLLKRRERALARLAKIEAELAALGLSPNGGMPTRRAGGRTGRRGPRPKNAMSLVEALQKVLTNKTMSVSEAGEAVLNAGYKTNAGNFRSVVNQTLLVNKDKFKKVDRGRYTAK